MKKLLLVSSAYVALMIYSSVPASAFPEVRGEDGKLVIGLADVQESAPVVLDFGLDYDRLMLDCIHTPEMVLQFETAYHAFTSTVESIAPVSQVWPRCNSPGTENTFYLHSYGLCH